MNKTISQHAKLIIRGLKVWTSFPKPVLLSKTIKERRDNYE